MDVCPSWAPFACDKPCRTSHAALIFTYTVPLPPQVTMGAEQSTEADTESATADTSATGTCPPHTATEESLLTEAPIEGKESESDAAFTVPRLGPKNDDLVQTKNVDTGTAPIDDAECSKKPGSSSFRAFERLKHPLSWRPLGWMSGRSESSGTSDANSTSSRPSARFTKRNATGNDPKHVFEGLEGLSLMVALNDIRQLKKLVAASNLDVNKRDADGDRVPLHWAAARGRTRCLCLLLESGADTSVLDSHGNTPARLAQQCEEDVAYSMLMNGLALSDPKSSSAMSNLPLLSQHASRNETKKLEACLRRGDATADPNQRDPDDDRYPLHWAAARGFLKSVEILLKAGAEIGAIDSHGQTAAGLAFSLNQHEVHKRLMNALAERTTQRAVGFSDAATYAQPIAADVTQVV